MSSTCYIDAFDEIVEDYSDDDAESLVSLDSFDIEEDEDTDFEVTFISDDEDEDKNEDEDEDFKLERPNNSEQETKEERMKLLNEKYKCDLEKCGEVLAGKLNWVTAKVPTGSMVNKSEFPDISTEPKREKKFNLKPLYSKKSRPLDIKVIVSNSPSQLIIPQKQQQCKYSSKVCPFGKNCRFKHNDKIQKKNWFCKNLIQTGTCRFGDRCIYSHTLEEIEQNVDWCKFKFRCNNVNRVGETKYINVGKYKCIHRHPNENITNLINRIQ
jgi:hypothetical protein